MHDDNDIVRVDRERVIRWVTVLAVVTVAMIAAIQSYSHMHDLAFTAGESWRSHLFPISVDGLVVAASMVLLSQQIMVHAGRRVKLQHRMFAASSLALGVMVSLSANIADAWDRGALPRAIAGWPALAFAVVFHLLLIQWKSVSSQVETVSETANVVLDTVPVVLDTVRPVSSFVPVVQDKVETVVSVPTVSQVVQGTVSPVQDVQDTVLPVVSIPHEDEDKTSGQTRTKVTLEQILPLSKQGLSFGEIGQRLGVSGKTVQRRLAASTNGHVTS